jgi:hypothetical protein
VRRLGAFLAAVAFLTASCALDPFDDPTKPSQLTAEQQRAAERLRADAVAGAERANALLYTAPTGSTRRGAWSGYGNYGERRVGFAESFWASTWPPAIIAADFRQRFPDLGWTIQPAVDPGEMVIVGHDPTSFVVAVYAHPTRPRLITGAETPYADGSQSPPPAGTQSYVTIAVIRAGAVPSPTAPVISVPPSSPS